jgi:hypothetical protein
MSDRSPREWLCFRDRDSIPAQGFSDREFQRLPTAVATGLNRKSQDRINAQIKKENRQ